MRGERDGADQVKGMCAYLVVSVCVFCCMHAAYADSLVLKSGKVINGRVTQQDDTHVAIDHQGVELYFARAVIRELVIDGKGEGGEAGEGDHQAGTGGGCAGVVAQLQADNAALKDTMRKIAAVYHSNLGYAYVQAKMYDEAIVSYEAAIKAAPDSADDMYNLGLLYENHRKDNAVAVSWYQRCLAASPPDADTRELAGIIEKLTAIDSPGSVSR
jgi:tetratricopeptide (TPR) repeat protein